MPASARIPMSVIERLAIESTDSGSMYIKTITAINKDLEQLNQLISEYNNADEEERLDKLYKIDKKRQEIEHTYSGELVKYCPEYHQAIHKKLFLELQKQFQSFDKLLSPSSASAAVPIEVDNPATFLANMPPEKIANLIRILLHGTKKDLALLYFPGEPGFTQYNEFLNHHNIEFLGGTNSHNFKVTPDFGKPPFVVKIENRLGAPKSAEIHLKEHSLKDTLIPVHAERPTIYLDDTSTPVFRSVVLTEFCDRGDIEDDMRKQANDSERTRSALAIYSQMARILEGIQHDGYAFSDMKNTNWLVDKSGTLRLADTKSFLPAHKEKDDSLTLSGAHIQKNWFLGFLNSPDLTPPECSMRELSATFSVEKMHVFMLGKNLYQYLTQCSSSYLNNKNSPEQFDFNLPIFKTEEGIRLKALIEQMIQPDPDARITLAEVKTILEGIKVINLLDDMKKAEFVKYSQECYAQLACINHLSFGEHDRNLKEYINEQIRAIQATTSPDELKIIKSNLAKQFSSLATEVTREAQELIASLRQQATLFTSGMNKAASEIEQAMAAIPLDKRKEDSDEIKVLRAMMESHRQKLADHDRFIAYKHKIQAIRETDAPASANPVDTLGLKLT